MRTGVTAILPRGKRSNDPVMAGWFSLRGASGRTIEGLPHDALRGVLKKYGR